MEKIQAYRTNYGELFSNENDAMIAEKNYAYKTRADSIADEICRKKDIPIAGRKILLEFLIENRSAIKELGILA